MSYAFIYPVCFLLLRTQLELDPFRDLHNHFQHYRDNRGNLTRHFSWYLQQDGPDHQKVHYATAKREPFDHSNDRVLSFRCAEHGHVIGAGSGISIGNAKYVAATRALQYLQSLPPRHPMFSLQ